MDAAGKVVSAAPVCYMTEEYLDEHRITFLKIGRDIDEKVLTDTPKAAVSQMVSFMAENFESYKEWVERNLKEPQPDHTVFREEVEETFSAVENGLPYDVAIVKLHIEPEK